ncbi:hypothetical protein [Candidatus Accumulibacter sp. ACC012]|uniref:hypothetical protein n=1 Tax=Candidatus Accumulibacter sp. ACC012 TaxID=2823332 RepID=UPI0025B80A6A|nr:hypothetical protein [Candidatus Accumulibacter sp. ACC012]
MPLVASSWAGKFDFRGTVLVMCNGAPKGRRRQRMRSGRRRFPFRYGSFLTILVNFIILAFHLHDDQEVNRLKRSEAAGSDLPRLPERCDALARDSRQD